MNLSRHISPVLNQVTCVNQLLFMINEIYKSFEGHEVRDIFLDISKEFSVSRWHNFQINGISENLLNLRNFLNEKRQRVVLNGQVCSSTSRFPSWFIIVFNLYKLKSFFLSPKALKSLTSSSG